MHVRALVPLRSSPLGAMRVSLLLLLNMWGTCMRSCCSSRAGWLPWRLDKDGGEQHPQDKDKDKHWVQQQKELCIEDPNRLSRNRQLPGEAHRDFCSRCTMLTLRQSLCLCHSQPLLAPTNMS
jgi:hypothetical protein